MAGDVRLKYVSVPITFDQAFDGIAYDFGDQGVGKALRVIFACASQQSSSPMCMFDVTGERGWKLLAQRCRFDSVEDCIALVNSMMKDGLCFIEHDGERELLGCQIVQMSVDGYVSRCERNRENIRKRWGDKKEGGGEASDG